MALLRAQFIRGLVRHLPATLRGRLILLGIATLVLASLLVFALMSVQQQRLLRSERVSSLRAQASVLAITSQAAVSFGDQREAGRLMEALSSNPVIASARIVLPDGSLFASHDSIGAAHPTTEALDPADVHAAGYRFTEHRLLLWTPIIEDNVLIARLEVAAALDDLDALFRHSLFESAFVIGLVLLLSLLLMSVVMQRLLLPVFELRELLRRLTANPALSARAQLHGGQEIAALGHGINELIDTIQQRGDELRRYRNNLEQLVEERTRALASAMAETDRANQAKSAFLARISHEIRTPMNAVIGLGNLLRRSSLSRRQRDQLDKMLVSSQALLHIINDLLDYSRIEAGKMRLESIPFRLLELAEQAIQVVAPAAEEKGLELLLLGDEDLPARVRGDPLRLRQILINLLGNAVKFTEQGTVLLHLRLRKPLAACAAAALRFSIHDTGIGISAEQQRMLFKPFTQADDSITRRFGGTGLGLSICAQLVNMMAGKIVLESKPGHGAHFHVDLDLPVSPGSDPAASGLPSLPFRHALVLSANNQLCWVVHNLLSQWGMRASCFDDAGRARHLLIDDSEAAADPVDVLIIDWQVGEQRGLELAAGWLAELDERSRKTGTCRPRFVLMLSNAEYASLEQSPLARLADAVLVKPLVPANLERAMREAATEGGRRASHPAGVAGGADPALSGLNALRGHCVLVVDDLPLNREVTRTFLHEVGIEVIEAADGEEAIAQLGSRTCSLVLMDVQMPVLDGLAATRRIRAGKIQADIPIIAVTAHATAEDRQHSLAAGMNDHLTKPVDAGQLYQVLQRWLSPAPRAALPAPPAIDGAAAFAANSAPQAAEASLPGDWPQSLPGLDCAHGLAYHLRRPDFYRRSLAEFVRSHAEGRQPAGRALAAGDHAAALRWAHSLKSSAATIGAHALSALAARFEQQLREQPLAITSVPGDLGDELEKVLDSIARLPLECEPTGKGKLDERALSLAGETLELLATADARAQHKIDELAALLHGSTWQAGIDAIRALIADVEYEDARHQLEQIQSAMKQTLS